MRRHPVGILPQKEPRGRLNLPGPDPEVGVEAILHAENLGAEQTHQEEMLRGRAEILEVFFLTN